jgi:hypothetical protein
MRTWLRRAWQWYLDRYHLVALIEVPPISGGMAPPMPVMLGLGDGPALGGHGSGLWLRRRRRMH